VARRSTIAAVLLSATALGSLSGAPALSHGARASAPKSTPTDSWRETVAHPSVRAAQTKPTWFTDGVDRVPVPRFYRTDTPQLLRAGSNIRWIDHLTVDKPVVFITIDDGFYRDPRVLDFFRITHLPVSLFLIGHVAAEGKDYFRALTDAGAVIEDHTQHHTRLTKLDLSGQRSEICEPVGPFETMFGRRPMFVRPPQGDLDADTFSAAASCGLDVVGWNAVLSRGKLSTIGGLKAGDIILIHFRPWIYTDLLFLMRTLNEKHLGVGLLEDYVRVTP
jgi:peptidoglycan/xylan/chitin deacetylase (PgdA/CDA1 family)